MGKTVAVVNQKGGVGKTTTAVNLAAYLGSKGKKILLIDLDPQGNSTSSYGINKREVKLSGYDLLIGKSQAENCCTVSKFKNVSVIASNMNLAGAEVELVNEENRVNRLRQALAKIKENYDYIFIDCPPSLGLITVNALVAADTVFVPIQCEYFALEGLSQLMSSLRSVKRLYNPNIEIEGILLTMYDGRLNLTGQVANEIKKYFSKQLYSTVIPRAVRLSESPSYGMPVLYYDPKSKGAIAYSDLAEEFLKRNRRG